MSIKNVVEEIKKDREALRTIAVEIAKDPDLQLVIMKTILGNVATREDLERFKEATRDDLERFKEAAREDLERFRKATEDDLERFTESARRDLELFREAARDDLERFKSDLIHYVDKRVEDLSRRMGTLQWMIGMGFTILAIIIAILEVI